MKIVIDGMIKDMVRMAVVCPLSGKSLDYRDCAVLYNSEGYPIRVFHPSLAPEVEKECIGTEYSVIRIKKD